MNAVGSQSLNWRSREAVPKEEAEQAEASGYTANCINCAPKNSKKLTTSALHSGRQLLWVPGKLNNAEFEKLLVDSGSPVMIMRRDLWNEVSGDNELLHTEEEDFQGVTEHGFDVLGRTHVRLRFGRLDVAHPVVVVDNIAHKFIIGNDFLLLHKCDILYSQDAILFGGKLVQFKLFRSTVNLISPVICQATTEIGPSEEVAIPCLLDSWKQYDTLKPLLLEPRKDALMGPVLGARVLVNSLSPAVTLLVANLLKERVIIPKNKVLADEFEVQLSGNEHADVTLSSVSQGATGENQPKKSPIEEAMANADKALTAAQLVSLESVLKKYSSAFSRGSEDLGRTSLILHKIDTGDGGPIRQGMRRIPHEQIPVLKTEIDKLQKAGAIEPSISPFASPVILVRKKDGTMRLCIDYRKLNAITMKDAHPLPRIEDIFNTLSGSKFFTTLDMAMGYHQVEDHPDDREKNGVYYSIWSLSIQSHAFRSRYGTSHVHAANDHCVLRHVIQHLSGVLRRYYHLRTDFRRAFRKARPRSYSCAMRKPQVETKQVPIRTKVSSLSWPRNQ